MPVVLLERDPELAAAAHLARRTSLSPTLDTIRSLAAPSHEEAVARVLSNTPDGNATPEFDEFREVVVWWLAKMVEPAGGIAERMAWFWHTILTTNAWTVDHGALVAKQLTKLRAGALGDFRSLLQMFVADGALLTYLDAAGNSADNPNENLGRELMELFSLGLGHYGQQDVESASRALSGAVVDRPSASTSTDPQAILGEPVTFLGERRVWTSTELVDRLCDHPATASRIAGLLWQHLVGTDPGPDVSNELGSWWQSRDLEIVPLIERILLDPAFLANRFSRPRSGLEYYCATGAAVGFTVDEPWPAERLGQMPYRPPSVAGWPDDRWLDPGSLLARTAHAQGWWFEDVLKAGPSDLDEVLDRAGIFEITQASVDALRAIDTSGDLALPRRNLVRWSAVFSAPEFQFA